MEPTHDQKRLAATLAQLTQAVSTLESVFKNKKTTLVRDAAVQRFEYTFELSWKAMSAASRVQGKPYNTPREAIRMAFTQRWIRDPRTWFKMLEARNRTSHTYKEENAEAVYKAAKKFSPLERRLLENLQNLSKD